MKKFLLALILSMCSLLSFSQCNTTNSICTPGTAGPFNFDPPGAPMGSCLDWIGPNIGYIVLYITTTGPLEILINGDAATGFLDVAVFDVPSGMDPCLAALDPLNEIGCNYATASSGCNQFGTFFPCPSSAPSPIVNAGDVIFIVVENWSGTSTTFTLDLGPLPAAQTGPPDATIVPAGPFLDTDPPFVMTSATGGGTWSADCGACIDPITGAFDPTLAGAGTWEICYTVGTAPCIDLDCDSVTVNPTCDVSLNGVNPTDPLCNGSCDGQIEVLATGTLLTYTLDVNPPQASNIFTGLCAGTYLITVTDNFGCTEDTTITLSEPTALTLVVSNDTGVCVGETANLLSFMGGGTPGYSYNWSNGSILPNISVTPVSTTQYNLIVTDGNNCTIEDSVLVTINPLPVITFTLGPDGCEPHTVSLTNTTPGSSTCYWDYTTGTSTNCNEVVTYNTDGSYNITLTVTDVNGCTNTSSSQIVTVYPLPIAGFYTSPSNPNIIVPNVNFSNTSTGGVSYEWNFGDGSNSSGVNPSHSYTEIGTYDVSLITTSINGCKDTINGQVIINDIVIFYVPNAFTPDGDGYNETFLPVLTSGFDPSSYHLTIYNRWGETIFESYNSTVGWDGTYAGNKVQDGVYVWVIEFKETMSDRKFLHRGHVTVLK